MGPRAGLEGCGKSRFPPGEIPKVYWSLSYVLKLQAMLFPSAHTYGFRLSLKMKANISPNAVKSCVFVLQAKRILADNVKTKLTIRNRSDMDCNNTAQDMEYWRTVVNTVANTMFQKRQRTS